MVFNFHVRFEYDLFVKLRSKIRQGDGEQSGTD